MILAIVQARVNSSRLPGKVLAEINGAALITHLLRRLSKSDTIDEIVVGTGPGEENEPLRFTVESEGYDCPRIECDEDDVLGRYVRIADMYDADTIVRITGDCPLIDWGITDDVVDALGYGDFATNVFRRTYARGMDTEVMTRETLLNLDQWCTDERREHVTLYLYDHPELLDIHSVTDHEDNSDLTLCVDYPEDLALVRQVYNWMGSRELPYREILTFVRERYGPKVGRIPTEQRRSTGDHRTLN